MLPGPSELLICSSSLSCGEEIVELSPLSSGGIERLEIKIVLIHMPEARILRSDRHRQVILKGMKNDTVSKNVTMD